MKKIQSLAALSLSALLALSLAGCGTSATVSSGAATAASQSTAAATSSAALERTDYDLEYSNRELSGEYDTATAQAIDLSAAGQDVTITAAGTYVLSGTLANGCVYVDATSEDKVQLVLNGAHITNSNGPCIYVKQADKVFVTLAEGSENSLIDGSSYVLEEGEDEPNAALFSKDDLCLNGTGVLSIQGNYRHAVKSKNDLVITGGTYTISAVEDGLNGKDCVKICDGAFTINVGEDGIQASNDTEMYRGFVSIDGGIFNITAADDGIHAETLMRVTAGEVNILASYEGYEGCEIEIAGGTTHIVASDDGINATNGSGNQFGAAPGAPGGGRMGGDAAPAENASASSGAAESSNKGEVIIRINGGYIYVDAQGDGVDSNGNVEMTGGVLMVSGPSASGNGAFDYDGTATISGGTVLMVGAAGMGQGFSGGTQASGMVSLNGSAGQQVSLVDSKGATVAQFTAVRAFQMVVVSMNGAAEGDTVTVKAGSSEAQVTLSTAASAGMGGMAPGMGHGSGKMSGMEPSGAFSGGPR